MIYIIKNEYKDLSIDEIIQILKQIVEIRANRKNNRGEGNELEELNGLLIPSNNDILVELDEIQFDDMKDRLDEKERNKHRIAHSLVTREIAEGLGIQTLSGTIFGNCELLN